MKCESFKKGLIKCIHTYRNSQYQQWKEHGYQIQIQQTMRIYLAISVIFMIIKVSLLASGYEWIILGVALFLHLTFFLLLNISNSMFLDIIPLIQLQAISWACYMAFRSDQSYLIVLVTITINFLSFYKSLYMKIISIILFTQWIIFGIELNSHEGLYLSLALLAIKIVREEWQLLQHFLNLQALFMIIDSIPQAMCIVNKSKNWLLYSNKVFENLALKLESGNPPETESPGKSIHLSTNFTKAQLNFLQNLKLDELNQQGVSLIELEPDELQFDDQYKIKDVIYNKQGMTSTFNFENPSPSKKLEQQQRFFQAFKLNDEENVIKKTYTSDVTMRLELQHQQQYMIQSALKKRFRKISTNQIKNANIQTPSRKVSLDQYLLSERKSGQKQSLLDHELSQSRPVSSVINHKVKFLVHVMENYKMIENNDDDEFQIYFIHELNQILLKSKLKKSENIKKNLLRSISHELLTNLNAVFGYIKQSQDRLCKKQSCEKELDLALKYTKLQLYKINDFFDYRDILEERFDMKKDKFEINSVIWECVDLLKDQIERKQLKIDVDLPEISYIILGDRQRLCQVLLNVIGNAIRFTFKGGISIIVQKKRYNDSMIGILDDVQSHEEMNMIEVWVNDTGIGMNEESLCTLRKKVYKMLSQLHVADEDEKITKQSVGQGLGLQVCKSIIKLLSPSPYNLLSVDSREGEGTQFYFSLRFIEENFTVPFEKRIRQPSVPQVDAESTQQVKVLTYNKPNQIISPCDCKTILIVDDEQFNIDILSHIIKNIGYDVDTALNGKQALDKVSLKLEYKCSQECIGYKCILMDINMPIMSGWEAVQRIRQLENLNKMTKTTPIIAITAYSSIQDQQKSINEGFNCVMIKPATKEGMLNTFQKLNI